jgi:hypothetical protein
MWDHMSQYDKVEVMDFLINVLKDHEKSLDALISRAEDVIAEKQSLQDAQTPGSSDIPTIKVVLKDWQEFRKRLTEVDLLCFDLIGSVFIISANTGPKVYEFRETIPLKASNRDQFDDKTNVYHLSIGLDLFAKGSGNERKACAFELDPQYTRNWLSKELSINQDFIVCGDIEL